MPKALLDRLQASRTFNQGFATVEYVASALVDLEMHSLESAEGLDAIAFEKSVLDKIGMPAAMVMRHRTPHFQHVFAGDGYSSAYYSYLWSETLDADGFGAFVEAGNLRWSGGSLPTNTSGGMLSEAYLHGLNLVNEAVRQVRGQSTAQVDDVEISFVNSGGGAGHKSALILSI